eukprot:403349667
MYKILAYIALTASQLQFAQSNDIGLVKFKNQEQALQQEEISLDEIEASYNTTVGQVITESSQRYLSHIQTDKVVYRPGDTMYIQAYIFDALNKTPAYSGSIPSYSIYNSGINFPQSYSEPSIYLSMSVVNPLSESVHSTGASMQNSTVSFTYRIPEDAVGGEYQVRTSGAGIPESIRVVRIRQYERQELNIQVQFNASVYKPGDFVNGTVLIQPADGSGFLNGQVPSFSVSVNFGNNSQISQNLSQTNELGLAYINFQIPQNFSLDYFSVAITAFYQNIIQGYTQTLTVVQFQNIYIEFFPETFNYVYNVTNKVYFQAYVSNQSNAEYVDIQEAFLVAESGIVNAESGFPISSISIEASNISTYHQGRGNFSFTPIKGLMYYLEFSSQNQSYRQQLNVSVQPSIDKLELNFGLQNKILENNEDLQVNILTTELLDDKNYYVIGVFNKEQIMYMELIKFQPNQTRAMSISSDKFQLENGGVLRLAVFQVINPLIWYDRYEMKFGNVSQINLLPNPFYNIYFIPKGELLFFKKPAEHLNVDILVSDRVYKPGEFVEFEVQVLNSLTLQPVGYNKSDPLDRSFISVIVSDESVNYQLDNRRQPPSLPAMVYLEKEISVIDNQFFNSEDYIDYIYQSGQESSFNNAPVAEVSNRNTDLLLGVQGWRYGYFYPQVLQEWPTLVSQMNSSEARQLENLMAYTFSGSSTPFFRQSPVAFAASDMATSGSGGSAAVNSESALGSGQQSTGQAGQVSNEGQPQDENQNQQSNQGLSSRELEFWNFIKKYQNCDFQENARLYQHAKRFSFFSDQASRFDTTETVFYSAASMTDRQGKYLVSFYLSDLITTYRITANAFDTQGRIGYSKSILISRSDFYVSFQLPQQMTLGDSLLIPVYIYNNFDQNVNATLEVFTIDDNLTANFLLNDQELQVSQVLVPAKNSSVILVRVTALSLNDNSNIQIRATARDPVTNSRVVDSIFRDTTIVSPGVYQYDSQSGLIGPNQSAIFIATLPSTLVPSTQELVAQIYPSNVDALLNALLSLIIDTPGPCFICIYNPLYANLLALKAAQVSSYSNFDVSRYQSQAVDFNRQLSSYINSDGSVSQFAGANQDPFLSVLYLLQQNFAASVVGTSSGGQSSVADYLLSLRSESGTYQDLIYPYQPYPDYVVESFIVYALASIGYADQLQSEIERLQGILNQQMNSTDADVLFIGIMSNIYLEMNQTNQSAQYLDFLAAQQQADGSILQRQLVDSDQERLSFNQYEATAAAVLGWQSDPQKYQQNIVRGINYLIENLRSSYYGSTIGVILSFNAILEYLNTVSDINGSGEFVLELNSNEVDRQYFTSESSDVIRFETSQLSRNNSLFAVGSTLTARMFVENYVQDEKPQEEISINNQSKAVQAPPGNIDSMQLGSISGMTIGDINFTFDVSNATQEQSGFLVPYFIEVSYDDTNPISSNFSNLQLQVQANFANATLGSLQTSGQIFSYNINITNLKQNDSLGLTILEFRPASCLQVNFAQLEVLKLNNIINEYQAIDNNSIIQIYFQGLDANQTISFQLDFLQAYQGVCQQRPIDVYEYYNPEQKVWYVLG